MCLSLHHDLTPMDKKYLEDLEFIKLWSRTPEETIQHHLDCIQYTCQYRFRISLVVFPQILSYQD